MQRRQGTRGRAVARATCPRCGVVHVDVGGLALIRWGDARWYQFSCPRCRDSVVTDTDERIATAMLEAGVTVRVLDPPAELDEPHTGPPVTLDDVLDLRLALEADDWIAEHARGANRR